ncbi:prevent-host-death protein, partial [Dysosmobacter welbionis]
VGAGDDGHPVLLLPHEGVVGDEEAVLEHLLHHRMAAVVDLGGPRLVHRGAAVVVPHRHRREGHQGVHLRHRGGSPLDAGAL